MGKGAVAYTDHIGDFYVNASGDLDVKFVFVGDQPEIQLKWNWLKINFVVYNRVHYNALNNQLKGDYFEIMKGDYSGEVQILEDIPTLASFQDITKRVFSGSLGTNYIFKLNLEEWSSYSFEQRAKIKADWKERISPNQVRLISFEAKNLNNIFAAIKARVAKKEGNTPVSDFIDELEDEFNYTDDSTSKKQDIGKKIDLIQQQSNKKEIPMPETIEFNETNKNDTVINLEEKPQPIKIERNTEPIYTYEDVQKVNCEQKIEKFKNLRYNTDNLKSRAIQYERFRCGCLSGKYSRTSGILESLKGLWDIYYSLKDKNHSNQKTQPIKDPELSPLPTNCRWRQDN